MRRPRRKPGQGSIKTGETDRHARNYRRIVCAFDDDTFELVRLIAAEESTSFAEQVRVLVEWGLETAGFREKSVSQDMLLRLDMDKVTENLERNNQYLQNIIKGAA